MDRELGAGRWGMGRSMQALAGRSLGHAGLHFSAPVPYPLNPPSIHAPHPTTQILSWGPQEPTAWSSLHGQTHESWPQRGAGMSGLETGSHSPSSSSGPAGGGPSSPSCFGSSSCKSRRDRVSAWARQDRLLWNTVPRVPEPQSKQSDPWAHLRARCPTALRGPERVTTSVRWGGGGQDVGREEGQPDHPELRRLSFESVSGMRGDHSQEGVGTV